MNDSGDGRDHSSRRELLKSMAGGAWLAQTARPQTKRPKKVIVAGGGIAGLCCGYELMKRGHDVTVLEAADRAGGHVRTYLRGCRTGCTWMPARSTSRSRGTTGTGVT